MGQDPFGTGTKLARISLVFTRDLVDPIQIGTGGGGGGSEFGPPDRICYPVPHGSIYEGDPISNRTIPVSNRSHVIRVDPIPNGSAHIRSRVSVA